MAQPVKGKTAIVTGAGSGINLAFATLLLSKGCNVVFADLALRPEAQQVVDSHSLASSNTGKAVFQKTDVTKWSQLDRMFDVAQREFGGVDLICPGAGVHEPVRRYLLQQAQPFSNFWLPPGQPPSRDSPISNNYALLDINLTHPIRSTQLAISRFLAASNPPSYPANPKSIILISSIAGQVSPLPAPLYNASKHAINGFVRSLAQLERKVGIRVAAVAPGVIKTPLWTDYPEKLKAVDEKVDEWVAPEDVAEVMLALVAEEQISQVLGRRDSEEAVIKIQGGTILEVSKGRVRDVQPFNDPGPLGRPGNTVGGMAHFENEVWDLLETKGWGTVEYNTQLEPTEFLKEELNLGFGEYRLQIQVPERGAIINPFRLVGETTSITGLTKQYIASLEPPIQRWPTKIKCMRCVPYFLNRFKEESEGKK